jgi:hypothetical protein
MIRSAISLPSISPDIPWKIYEMAAIFTINIRKNGLSPPIHGEENSPFRRGIALSFAATPG